MAFFFLVVLSSFLFRNFSLPLSSVVLTVSFMKNARTRARDSFEISIILFNGVFFISFQIIIMNRIHVCVTVSNRDNILYVSFLFAPDWHSTVKLNLLARRR